MTNQTARRNPLLPAAAGLVLLLLALPGCRHSEESDTMKNTNDPMAWLSRPNVLAVIFHPRTEDPFARPPAGCRELSVPVAPDAVVGARFHPAGTNDPVILFFHGNGEIVQDYDTIAPFYTAQKINFLAVDYRGYGKSTGSPTVAAMLQDADTIFRFVPEWLKKEGCTGPLIVMGRSLGSASALELAARYPADIAALIVDSGFAQTLPLLERLGAELTADDRRRADALRQTDKIRAYKGPTLIVHGQADEIIPVAEARALLAASSGAPKTLLIVRGAGHNDVLFTGYHEYAAAVANLVRQIRK